MDRKVYCSNCGGYHPVQPNENSFICCTGCGKVVDQAIYSDEPTFVKNAAGQSQLAGSNVRSVASEYTASRELTLNKAHDTIVYVADNLGIEGGDRITKPARALYIIALERNFTKGRRADQVAATCLYITCREKKLPFLLIEFAEVLGFNVYKLGDVFLQLCKLLHLEEHPNLKPVDPSLYIHRFTNVLLGQKDLKVEKTALRIMASMKRDWMQTGRKPSGLCGAALYISALAHGYKFTKTDVIKIVHVCEVTLTKRLIEFEDTTFGSLTTEELNQNAEELERNPKSSKDASSFHKSEKNELLCEHKGRGIPHFAHGLCESCHEEFVNISGGLDGGADPPAFQRAERERMAKLHKGKRTLDADTSGVESGDSRGVSTKGTSPGADHDKAEGAYHASTENGDESDNFSDIDDTEVDGYLHNEEETELKKVIWEEINREYLEQQAEKQKDAAAELASFQNCSPEERAARELAAAVAAKTAKSKKEQRAKRAAEAKTPQTAAEATYQMLKRKKLSSKVNYDAMKDLFPETNDSNNAEPNPKESNLSPIREEDDPETRNRTDDDWGTTVDGEEEDYYNGSNAQDNDYYNEDEVYNGDW